MKPSGKLEPSTIQSISAYPSQHVETDRGELHQPWLHNAPITTPPRAPRAPMAPTTSITFKRKIISVRMALSAGFGMAYRHPDTFFKGEFQQIDQLNSVDSY